jgi:hypothetical protein
MAVRVTKGILKASDLHESPEDHHAHEKDEQRPRNMPPNTFPTEGFSVEVDGKIKSQHPTAEAALKVGTELKAKYPVIRVTIYDAVAKTRSLVDTAKAPATA